MNDMAGSIKGKRVVQILEEVITERGYLKALRNVNDSLPKKVIRSKTRVWSLLTLFKIEKIAMKKSRFTEEKVTLALRQVEGGTAVEDACRSLEIFQATFYIWKKKYGDLGASEVHCLRQLEDENVRLKRLVADLILDKNI